MKIYVEKRRAPIQTSWVELRGYVRACYVWPPQKCYECNCISDSTFVEIGLLLKYAVLPDWKLLLQK